MKRVLVVLAVVISAASLAVQVQAAEFEFHGDLNHRFNLYTDQAVFFNGVESVADPVGISPTRPIKEDSVEEIWGDIKYRLWATASTNDGAVRGTYAIELGALRFGRSGSVGKSVGGGFSGDGVNIETRWAFTDLAVPGTDNRLFIGLQPFKVNKYVWNETAMGIQFKGKADAFNYILAWMRGSEFFNDDEEDDLLEDFDGFLVRGDFQTAENIKIGLFGLYERSDSADEFSFISDPTDEDFIDINPLSYQIKSFDGSDFGIWTIGTDGSFTTPTEAGNIFVNWDLMYQGGEIEEARGVFDGFVGEMDADVSAFFVHVDVGANIHRFRLTYTGWYASGDDDPDDGDLENFLTTDVDIADSIIFFEGGYTDDNYFTEAPHILDKGMIFNKLEVDFKYTEKTSFGGALIYAMTAEDLPNGEDKLGTEVDAYMVHDLYPNVSLAINAGYLFADDGMSFWSEGDEEDIFRTTARIRYKF